MRAIEYLVSAGYWDRARGLIDDYNSTHVRTIGDPHEWFNRRQRRWALGTKECICVAPGTRLWRKRQGRVEIATPYEAAVITEEMLCRARAGEVVPDVWGSFSLTYRHEWYRMAWWECHEAVLAGARLAQEPREGGRARARASRAPRAS